MAGTYLHVGCGPRKLAGFINIDMEAGADMQLDVRQGLPFANQSVDGIFSEHFFEHLTLDEGLAFLRECHRVLAPAGLVRIATPDLDALIAKYCGDWRDQEWIRDFGYEWLPNRCYMLNLSMRNWDHRWVYNEEELQRVATLAGFPPGRCCALGQSEDPRLRGLEYRTDSVVMEFQKPGQRANSTSAADQPLVSILIPAYHTAYARFALESALNQSYRNTEIVICDDSPTIEVAELVAAHADDPRIVYVRNQPRLGSRANYLQCFNLARGEYIKFLNDDDILALTCVERMVAILRSRPDVTLVTSHRRCIDCQGNPLPDCDATNPLVERDAVLDGRMAMGTVLGFCCNFIGEPTTTLFRKRDADATPDFMSFSGRPYDWSVDMVLWAHLLTKGNLAFLADRLSFFRLHPAQEQRSPGAGKRATEAFHQLRQDWVHAGGTLASTPSLSGTYL